MKYLYPCSFECKVTFPKQFTVISKFYKHSRLILKLILSCDAMLFMCCPVQQKVGVAYNNGWGLSPSRIGVSKYVFI